jgi:hypothetical protein
MTRVGSIVMNQGFSTFLVWSAYNDKKVVCGMEDAVSLSKQAFEDGLDVCYTFSPALLYRSLGSNYFNGAIALDMARQYVASTSRHETGELYSSCCVSNTVPSVFEIFDMINNNKDKRTKMSDDTLQLAKFIANFDSNELAKTNDLGISQPDITSKAFTAKELVDTIRPLLPVTAGLLELAHNTNLQMAFCRVCRYIFDPRRFIESQLRLHEINTHTQSLLDDAIAATKRSVHNIYTDALLGKKQDKAVSASWSLPLSFLTNSLDLLIHSELIYNSPSFVDGELTETAKRVAVIPSLIVAEIAANICTHGEISQEVLNGIDATYRKEYRQRYVVVHQV